MVCVSADKREDVGRPDSENFKSIIDEVETLHHLGIVLITSISYFKIFFFKLETIAMPNKLQFHSVFVVIGDE